ncbi:MAG: monovalent cation/H(+) antiporter subunit G [Rhodobacteraceae bacterium]|nr:MAG: monovalent cation/H(+) antiporter subunit G [Paracoccaceae bacterium]
MSGWQLFIEILSWALISAGSFFVIVGAIGVYRFPDFWTRLHAASVAESAGVILLLTGMMVQAGWGLIAVKLLIIGVFLFITGPTSTHAVANAALVSGLRPKSSDDGSSDDPDAA